MGLCAHDKLRASDLQDANRGVTPGESVRTALSRTVMLELTSQQRAGVVVFIVMSVCSHSVQVSKTDRARLCSRGSKRRRTGGLSVKPLELRIALPDWVGEFLGSWAEVLPALEDRMRLVIDLARENIRRETGGPFGAGVFDEAGRLVAAGVNLVVSSRCSILHAEMVAIALAQKHLGRHDLGDGGRHAYELVTAVEPCAMCFGAIPWSGLSRVVCGARGEDAQRIGFDEGPKVADWVGELESRGIRVVQDVLRAEAAAVLDEYARCGGRIY